MSKYPWIVVVLVLLVGGFLLLRRGGQPVGLPSDGVQETPEAMVLEDKVVVTDYEAGMTATAASVSLQEAGYVVIHEDKDGKPGAVLGNSEFLAKGESENIVVTLSRESVEGEVLYAMLHSDDGDAEFSFPGPDVPLADEEGNIVLAKYTVGEN